MQLNTLKDGRRRVPNDSPDAIFREIRINATPETVFAFLIDPQKMTQWIGRSVELDPRRGGIFRIDVNGRDVIRGEIVEVNSPRKIVFTWGWEGEGRPVPPGSTTVEITLEPDGEQTILRLTHRGLTGEDQIKHAQGWTHYQARIRTVAQGEDPGPDPLGTLATKHG